MQKIKIEELDYQQQEKLKPVIEQQKNKEKTTYQKYIGLLLYFVAPLPFVAIFVLLLILYLIFFDNGLTTNIEMVKGGLLIFSGAIFLIIVPSYFIKKAKVKSDRSEEDDFYILYGYAEDIDYKKDINQNTNFYYIIERKSIEVAAELFPGFRYSQAPVQCYRYFLLREQDNRIRNDITDFFYD